MSMQINTYLDGVLQEVPAMNTPGLAIELNFDRDKGAVKKSITANSFEFAAKINKTLQNIIAAGKTGGKGVFKGHDFRLDLKLGTTTKTVFDGYIDLTKSHRINPEKVSKVEATEKHSVEFLTEQARGFTFEKLYKVDEFFTSSDFEFMPYVLNSVPNYKEAAITLLSVFVVGQQVKECIEHITALGIEMANPFEATSILRMIGYLAYLVTLLISLVTLIKQVVQLIIQPVKYHACMNALKLCQIGASYLGYTFHSPDMLESLSWKDLTIMPEKYYNPVNSTDPSILGFTKHSTINQEGFFKGTFEDLLEGLKRFFKAKLVVTKDKKIYLVDQNYNVTTPTYQLRDYRFREYEMNTDEMDSSYVLKFTLDSLDKNTVQNYTGNSYTIFTQPLVTEPGDINLKTKGTVVDIPFARATRKEALTKPEKIVDDFLSPFDSIVNALIKAVNVVIGVCNKVIKVINKIIDALGVVGIKVDWEIKSIPTIAPVSLGTLIENRIGMMVLETDTTSVPKIFLMNKGSQPKFNKLYSDNDTRVSAKRLWNSFHSIVSFVPTSSRPNANQYLTYPEIKNIPFELEDFLKVEQNNIIFDNAGNEIEYTSLIWRPWQRSADIIIRKNELYDSTLIHAYTESDGR